MHYNHTILRSIFQVMQRRRHESTEAAIREMAGKIC